MTVTKRNILRLPSRNRQSSIALRRTLSSPTLSIIDETAFFGEVVSNVRRLKQILLNFLTIAAKLQSKELFR